MVGFSLLPSKVHCALRTYAFAPRHRVAGRFRLGFLLGGMVKVDGQ